MIAVVRARLVTTLAVTAIAGCGARTSPAGLDPTPNGPSTSTCDAPLTVIDDRPIGPVFDTNDFPSLAFDASGAPVALLEQWDGGFRGSLARRDASGAWSMTALPARTASGAIALGAPGPIAVASYDGAGSSSLLVEDGARFAVSPMPSHDPIRSTNLWRDHAGALHFVTDQNVDEASSYFFYDGTYHRFPLDPAARAPMLALGGGDVPWIVWLAPSSSSTSAVSAWRGDTHAIEPVANDVAGLYGVAVGANGQPIVVTRDVDSAIVTYARRDEGTWSGTSFTVGAAATAVAVVSSCDGLSLLVARNLEKKGEIALARGSAIVQILISRPAVEIRSMRAIVDGASRVHVIYDEGSGAGSTARYALIAPSTP